LEDAAVMRSIPNITVVCPADCAEIIKTVQAAAQHTGPMYIRLTGAVNNPPVYTEDYAFKIGRSVRLREGTDITFIANGTMVYESLEAAKLLQAQDVSAAVVNMHTLKPLDTQAIDYALRTSGAIVTVEEHSVIGGLGAAVAEYTSRLRQRPPHLILGLPDTFIAAADYRFMLEREGLIGSKISMSVMEFLGSS
jgi:transketolase